MVLVLSQIIVGDFLCVTSSGLLFLKTMCSELKEGANRRKKLPQVRTQLLLCKSCSINNRRKEFIIDILS